MTTLETILVSVLSTLGAVVLAAWLFWRWGLRKIAGVRAALGDVHGRFDEGLRDGIRGGRTPDTDPMPSSYSTLEDEEPEVPISRDGRIVLPVVQPSCETCAAWSHDAGQRLFDARPAFRAAGMFLTPAQMGQKRNPAFMALERQIFDLEKGKAEPGTPVAITIEGLRAELAATSEFLNVEGIEKNMKVTWADFGLCTSHREIRAKTDCCDRFAARSAS